MKAMKLTESLETHWNGQLLVVKGDKKRCEYISVDLPIHYWHDINADLDFLVVTSYHSLALKYAALTQRMEKPYPTYVDGCTVRNQAGGTILYTSFGVALAGRRFDYMILSDPLDTYADRQHEVLSWLHESLHTKLIPL